MIQNSIQQAFRISGFIEWRNTRSYCYRFDQVTDTLRRMLDDGQAEAVIELTEYAMKRWENREKAQGSQKQNERPARLIKRDACFILSSPMFGTFPLGFSNIWKNRLHS